MLKGKTAIITGAAKGIGRAIAIAFAKEGCNIVLNYRSNLPDDLIDEIKSFGVDILTVKADVSNSSDAASIVSAAKEKFGTIDILVNNAGITKDGLIIRMSEEMFDSVINTNLKGVFNLTKSVSPYMIKQRSGRIINISSVAGLVGNAGQCNYSASKAGVIGFTKAIAKELGGRGILCNAIAPGFIETDMTDVINDNAKKTWTENIPLKFLGKPEYVAEAAVFLAKASYVTGQVINVDGGMVMN